MKRLAVRRFPEKLTMAAIILSCGLVMQAEPTAKVKAKGVTAAGPEVAEHVQAAHPATHRMAKAAPARPHQPAW